MFDWLTEIDNPINEFSHDDRDLSIEKFESQMELNEMSEVCLFFSSFGVILEQEEETVISLPTPNEKAIHTILNEVVPHYKNVQQILYDGKLKYINVRNLKNESKRIVENLLIKNFYSVIPDLYRTKKYDLSPYPRVIKFYQVNLESICPLHLKQTEKIQDFLSNSFFLADGLLPLQPKGWVLNDKLQESITIRTFSTFAKQIVLVVNDNDKSVIGLDIFG